VGASSGAQLDGTLVPAEEPSTASTTDPCMAAICGLFERAALVAWPNDLGDPAAKQPVFFRPHDLESLRFHFAWLYRGRASSKARLERIGLRSGSLRSATRTKPSVRGSSFFAPVAGATSSHYSRRIFLKT